MAWVLRPSNGRKPKYSNLEYFTIKLNHGGNLIKEDVREYYVGGTVNYFDYCDTDRISKTELQAMFKEISSIKEPSFYSRIYGLDGKWVFKSIQTDGDVTSMVLSISNGLLEIYVVEKKLEDETNAEIIKYVEAELEDVDISSWDWGSFSRDDYAYVDLASHKPATNEPPPPSKQNPPPTTTRIYCSDSENEFRHEVFIDSEYDLSEDDDDALFDANVDKEIEWTGVRQKRVGRNNSSRDCLSETESEEGHSSDGFMSLGSCSDEEEGEKPTVNKYRHVLGKVQPIIEECMIFKNRAQCVEAIRQHAILTGKAITIVKNDTNRVRAQCADPCPWKILASSITDDRKTLKVKTYNSNHDCGWMWNNKLLNSSWLARTYYKEFKIKPSWTVSEIAEQVMGDFNVKISLGMAYNAREKAIKKMEGCYAEQYEKLWDYCGEMVRTNPGTLVHLHFKKDLDGMPTDKFERMYICWAALKKGFVEGCRPIIGLDDCHLKGPHGGQLLTAVGIDGNNQIYPVAYEMVEVEDEACWSWFLHHLKNDLYIPNEPTFTIIPDKQKGLINAIQNLLPCVEHRHCVRHLHDNMKSAGHTGQAVKEKLWSLARATYMGRFNSIMEEFKKEDGAAFNWLCKHDPHHWSRSHFSEVPKCDMLLNNLCESFNAAILDARDKPIITMLERIRIYLVKHLVKRKASVDKWRGEIGPKIVKLLDKNIDLCKEYIVILTGDNRFEVRGFYGNNYCVDLAGKTCSCRRWELTDALAVFRESRTKVHGIVHDYYQKKAYINTYKHVMYPLNGMDMWEKTKKPPIQPPHYTRKSGRPRKCKRREADEPPTIIKPDGTKKLKRSLKQLSCRRCGGKGHNVRTCSSSFTTPGATSNQCSQPITQPTYSQPSQPTSSTTVGGGATTRRAT